MDMTTRHAQYIAVNTGEFTVATLLYAAAKLQIEAEVEENATKKRRLLQDAKDAAKAAIRRMLLLTSA